MLLNFGSCAVRGTEKFFAGCSVIALAAATPAWADCTPKPTTAFGTVTCTGNDPAGLVVDTNQTTVNIDAGADVASIVTTTRFVPFNAYPTNFISIFADGRISGGLTVESGTIEIGAPPIFPSTMTNLMVGVTGAVQGPTAIRLIANPALLSGTAQISIDNSGTIQSTSGPAILATDSRREGISSLTNQVGGSIGGVHAVISYLNNRGTIDGGSDSAVRSVITAYAVSYPYTFNNSGSIKSTSNAATVDFEPAFYATPNITNSGTIENSGNGNAIFSSSSNPYSSMLLVNESGGKIISRLGAAIVGDGFVRVENNGTISGSVNAINSGYLISLINRGTINGSITALGGSGYLSSFIDNTGGLINGGITLGDGDDMLVTSYSNSTNLLSGITGSVNAGGGTNTLKVNFVADATLEGQLLLPSSFQVLGFGIVNGATLTLGTAYNGTSLLTLSGEPIFARNIGHFVNKGKISTSGTALQTSSNYYDNAITITNDGLILANLASPYEYAVRLSGANSFVNTGTITANGGSGIDSSIYPEIVNSGSITADYTGVSIFSNGLNNSGSIVSRFGTGAVLSGSQNMSRNSGTISGATAGVRIVNVTLINSGTISSAGSGIILDPYGNFENRAGGVVNGGIGPIGGGFTYNGRLTNAGIINGNVNFGDYQFGYGSGNTFIAQPGGIVNGNLFLGGGNDLFVTSLTNTGPGQFAGVTGTVTSSGNSEIRYLVTQDAAATLALPGFFTTVGYDLSNSAKLTLTAAAPLGINIAFTGTGRVDLAADLTSTGERTLLDLTKPSIQTAGDPPVQVPTKIDFISRGTLTGTHDQPYSYAAPIVLASDGGSFTNAGTIFVNELAQNPYGSILNGIAGGGTITNSGTISLNGGIGIAPSLYGYQNIINNTGTINQQTNGADGIGISGNGTITNSGTIRTGGSAILFGLQYSNASGFLTNSGTIRSDNREAVRSTGYLGSVQVRNASTGVISGGASSKAIALFQGSVVDNSGAINGSVDLGYFEYGFAYPGDSIFINRGGTLNGNLSFGDGDDTFVAIGGVTGVTGTIDAGTGIDTYAIGYTSSQTVDALAALPATFERFGVGAIGAGTIVTVTGPAAGLNSSISFFGDGKIVNRANVNGSNPCFYCSAENRVVVGYLPNLTGFGGGLDFVNEGKLADGVAGNVKAFANTGTIGSAVLNYNAVNLNPAATVGTFVFDNSGTILTSGNTNAVVVDNSFGQPVLTSASLTNSGIITGDLRAGLLVRDLSFSNSGTISGVNPALFYALPGVELTVGQGVPDPNADTTAGRVTVSNTGRIDNGLALYGLSKVVSVTNTGTLAGVADGSNGLSVAINSNFGIDQDSISVSNQGRIANGAYVSGNAKTITIGNSGSITIDANDPMALSSQSIALNISASTNANQITTVTNSGTVINGRLSGSGIFVATNAVGDPGMMSPPPVNASIEITNSGTVRANGGATVDRAGYPAPDQNYINPVVGIAGFAGSDGQSSVVITNASTGVVEASGALRQGNVYNFFNPPPVDHSPIVNAPAGFGSIAVAAYGDRVTITNDGKITGGVGGTFDPADFIALVGIPLENAIVFPDRYIAGAIQTFLSKDVVTNGVTGVITGSIDLGALDDRLVNLGSITGDVFLRDGNDSFLQRAAGDFNGIADGGTGIDLITIDSTGSSGAMFDLGRFVNFEKFSLTGTGSVTVFGGQQFDTINIDNGTLTVDSGKTLGTAGPLTISGMAGNESVINNGTIAGGIDLDGGNDSIVNAGRIVGPIGLGEGTNTLTNHVGTTIVSTVSAGGGNDALTNNGMITGLVNLGDGVATVTNGGTLAGGLMTGTGDDQITNSGVINTRFTTGSGGDFVSNSGWITTLVDLGDGVNQFTNAASGMIDAGLRFGAGNDQINNAGSLAGPITLGAGSNALTNSGTVTGTVTGGVDTDTLTNSGTVSGAIDLGAGANVLTNSGRITGALTFGAGDDVVSNTGTITTVFDLGMGHDQLTLGSTSIFGAVSGGTGVASGVEDDLLILALSGTEAAPDELNLTQFTNFERLRVTSGTGALSGTANFGTIDIVSGRLIWRANSVVTSTNGITVASGSTFGTAGTVNSNILVNGTLAPGASPGTMTVNGNVTFATGSTALYELTPTVSDKLVVNGAVSIATGTTLNLTGTRPLVPGAPLDLITATSGTTGSFTTITKPASIFGFVRQQGSAIQLVGLFPVDPVFTPQVSATVNYLNTVLQTNQASAGLQAALPGLVSQNGGTNAAAFALLNPEAYASATQIGVENGLAIAGSFRAAGFGASEDHEGPFSYAQGFGNGRRLAGDAAKGTSRGNVDNYGLLGGLGYGTGTVLVSAFIGYVDGRQSIATLNAKNKTNGVVAGATANLRLGGFRASAVIAYDGSSLDTTRALPGNVTTGTRTNQHAWTSDFSASYIMPVGTNWSVEPQIGFTAVSVRRGGAVEASGSPFDLTVLGRKSAAIFADASLTLRGGKDAAATFSPWVSAGVRTQLSGNATFATAAFKGATAMLTVEGVDRPETVGTLSGGFSVRLSNTASLFTRYVGEFGGSTNDQNVSTGIRIHF